LALVRAPGEGAAAEQFRIVRMRADGQNVDRVIRHAVLPSGVGEQAGS
jgi:hypothetical protein